jgi:putative glutamine amidotransferase
MTCIRKRPLIGVTDSEKANHFPWLCIRICVWLAGGKAVRITPEHPLSVADFNGFILSGGGDINPSLYGEASIAEKKQYDVLRDIMEINIAKLAIEKNIPLLGICRGAQVLNVAADGSLYQEVGHVFDDFLPTNSLLGKLIARRDVRISTDSLLFHIMGKYKDYRVNSLHHQGINKLGEGLRTVAIEENGLIQAIENSHTHPHTFLIGVQWHPELMLHVKSARGIFKELVKRTICN